MTNVQQPEMRRSGHDPLVMDSAKERAGRHTAPSGSGAEKDTRPAEQRSSYGPERGEPESHEAEEQEAGDHEAEDEAARRGLNRLDAKPVVEPIEESEAVAAAVEDEAPVPDLAPDRVGFQDRAGTKPPPFEEPR